MEKIKIFLIAGEASGDLLGGKLMAALKEALALHPLHKDKELEFLGIGGQSMAEQGLKQLYSTSQLSVMGFAEIAPHLKRLLGMIKRTAEEIISTQPALLITIDAPDFCFRVVKKVKAYDPLHNIKRAHLVAPSVWAYREGRAKKIAQLYDLLLAILPFEPPYFEKYGLKTIFIGHPILEEAKPVLTGEEFRKKYHFSKADLLICLTPGSRKGEVQKILPEMVGALNILFASYPNLKVLIPTLPKTKAMIEQGLSNLKPPALLIDAAEKPGAFLASNLALAKSGTNTLELSKASLPMVVVYKVNIISYLIIKSLVKIRFANLVNLLLNREVIPELLQNNCQADKIAAKLKELIDNPAIGQAQIRESQIALKMLGQDFPEQPSQKAAKALLELIS